MSGRDVVYFSPIPWRGLYQRPQHTARALTASRRVLFVEPRTLHAPAPPPDEERLAFLTLSVLPVNARRPFVRAMARVGGRIALVRDGLARRHVTLLRRRIAALGLNAPVLLFGHPELASLREGFPGLPVIYDHMDDILEFGHGGGKLRRRLRGLVAAADVLSASASGLRAQLVEMGGRDPLLVGNGVELEHFARREPPPPCPPALAALSSPRALYVGSVAEWFDVELLHAVARARPSVSFAVVGPVRPALERAVAEAPANCRYLGAQPYAELPGWLHHADVALIPFRRTRLTAGVDPVKLYEYLAAELPVVATSFSPELQAAAAEGALRLANDPAAFAAALDASLATPPDGPRLRALAERRRWTTVLAPLLAAIDAL